jgi:predicted GIY-YIG superfamily endonuclease
VRDYVELYRHYNIVGMLLYVGQSATALKRLVEHRRDARWFNEVSYVTIVRIAKHLIDEAERQAIEAEKPIYNRTYNQKKRSGGEPPIGHECYLVPGRIGVPLDIKCPLRVESIGLAIPPMRAKPGRRRRVRGPA